MLSQFESPHPHRKLGELDFNFPEGTNAVGRLDYESEGLLILTTDRRLTQLLLNPEKKHKRNYLVQVHKQVNSDTLKKLRQGIEIFLKGKNELYVTKSCEVNLVEKPNNLPYRDETLMERIPQSWLEFVLTEGKNRQIRKMCRTVRHKCWRLIRTKIENLELGNMQPGEVREINREELFKLLLIEV